MSLKHSFFFFFFSSGWWNPSVLSVITQPTASIFNLHFYPSFLLIYDLPLISFPIPSIFPSCSSLSPSDPTLSEYGPRRLPVSLVCRRLQRLLLLSDPPGQGRRTIPSVPVTSRPESSAQQAAAAAASDAGPPAGYHPLIACIPLSFNLLTPFGCLSHGWWLMSWFCCCTFGYQVCSSSSTTLMCTRLTSGRSHLHSPTPNPSDIRCRSCPFVLAKILYRIMLTQDHKHQTFWL